MHGAMLLHAAIEAVGAVMFIPPGRTFIRVLAPTHDLKVTARSAQVSRIVNAPRRLVDLSQTTNLSFLGVRGAGFERMGTREVLPARSGQCWSLGRSSKIL
jgi:hypothetical protein